MAGKLPVKSRIYFSKMGSIYERHPHLDIVATYNMADKTFRDREPDMEVVNEDGERSRIDKAEIVEIKEVRVIQQVAEEVGQAAEPANE